MIRKSFYISLALILIICVPCLILIIDEYGFQSWVVWLLLLYTIFMTIYFYVIDRVRKDKKNDLDEEP